MAIELTLPYPPSANRYWRTNRNGHVYKSEDAKAYAWHVMAAAPGVIPFTQNVRVEIDVYRPRRSGDLDNRLKVTMDSLEGIAYEDDAQVVELHARRFDDKHNPRVEVRVEPVAEVAA